MSVLAILSAVFLLLGGVLLLAAGLGVVRFPDFYTRLHAAGKGDTLGQALVLLGLGLAAGLTLVSLKLALMAFFIFVLNPTATHALARGAWICGLRPWQGEPTASFHQTEGQMSPAQRASLFRPDTSAAQALGPPDDEEAGGAPGEGTPWST